MKKSIKNKGGYKPFGKFLGDETYFGNWFKKLNFKKYGFTRRVKNKSKQISEE